MTDLEQAVIAAGVESTRLSAYCDKFSCDLAEAETKAKASHRRLAELLKALAKQKGETP